MYFDLENNTCFTLKVKFTIALFLLFCLFSATTNSDVDGQTVQLVDDLSFLIVYGSNWWDYNCNYIPQNIVEGNPG
jgi:hypothetical protein